MATLKRGGQEPLLPAYRRARGYLARVESALLSVSALMILAMTLYVATGIVLRTFFGGRLYDEVAIIGELMVMSISLALAFVAAERGYVAVEIVTAAASHRTRVALDVLGSAVGLIALIPITIAAWSAGVRAWEEGSYHFGVLNLPEWPGYFVYLIGMAAFLVRLVDLIIHDLLCAFGVIEDDDTIRQID